MYPQAVLAHHISQVPTLLLAVLLILSGFLYLGLLGQPLYPLELARHSYGALPCTPLLMFLEKGFGNKKTFHITHIVNKTLCLYMEQHLLSRHYLLNA